MVRSRFLLACVTFSALFASAPSASANGRFPEANAIFLSDGDPNLVILRVTFGMMVSHDRGKTWSWVCERSVGAAGVEDPMYAVTPGGTIVGSTFQGLAISTDKACSFSFAGGPLANLVFVDLAARPNDSRTIVAFASSYDHQDNDGGIVFRSQLFETTDEARSWTQLGAPLDPSLLGETVDYAASDPDRLYVSAVADPGVVPRMLVLTSRDRGKKFDTTEIPRVGNERAAFIAAVDPTNADRLYVRTQDALDQPSRLLVSEDGGKSFRTIYSAAGALLGFALSKDGKKVYVGGPKDGVRVASTSDYSFQQKSTLEVQCLTMGADGLWACSNEKAGFVTGLSTDDGATFEARLHFCDVKGALDCPAGTPTKDQCGAAWPQQKAVLGCETTTGDGGESDGSASEAGPGGADGGKSCGCRAVGEPSPLTLGSLLGSLGALAFLIRRRRR